MLKTKVIYKALRTYQKQRAAFDDAPRFAFLEGSTKSGKTAGALDWQIRQWINDDGAAEHWWVAPVYGQANIAFSRVKRALTQSIKLGMISVNNTDRAFINHKDCVWRFRSALNEDNLYGEDVQSLVLDEASRTSEGSFISCRSTLTATRGKARIIGNIRGTSNWFYKLCRLIEGGGMPNTYSYSKLTSSDAVKAGVLDPAEIEEAKRIMPQAAYEELYLCIAQAGTASFFKLPFNYSTGGDKKVCFSTRLGFSSYRTKRRKSRSRLHLRCKANKIN